MQQGQHTDEGQEATWQQGQDRPGLRQLGLHVYVYVRNAHQRSPAIEVGGEEQLAVFE